MDAGPIGRQLALSPPSQKRGWADEFFGGLVLAAQLLGEFSTRTEAQTAEEFGSSRGLSPRHKARR